MARKSMVTSPDLLRWFRQWTHSVAWSFPDWWIVRKGPSFRRRGWSIVREQPSRHCWDFPEWWIVREQPSRRCRDFPEWWIVREQPSRRCWDFPEWWIVRE
jgi:hypothetical protein